MIALALLALLAQNLRGDEALSKVLADGEPWRPAGEGSGAPGALCGDGAGGIFLADPGRGTIHRVGADGRPALFARGAPRIGALALGPDGRLYAAGPGQILAIARDAKAPEVLAEGVRAHALAVTRRGFVFFTDPEEGRVMVLAPQGRARVAASGLAGPGGLALSPDHGTLAVAERGGAHVWAFRVETSGELTAGMPWMDLRPPTGRTEGGGAGMAVDEEGRWYVGSPLGVQMFDGQGRMGGVIGPPPGGAPAAIAFAGPDRAYLYALAGGKLYRRRTKTRGAPPLPPPS